MQRVSEFGRSGIAGRRAASRLSLASPWKADTIRQARAYARVRFPALASAPVIETRVCQYETTPDTEFLLDRHPDLDNVWIAGGGSGHAFKHGPALGERMEAWITGAQAPEPRFGLGPRAHRTPLRTIGEL